MNLVEHTNLLLQTIGAAMHAPPPLPSVPATECGEILTRALAEVARLLGENRKLKAENAQLRQVIARG